MHECKMTLVAQVLPKKPLHGRYEEQTFIYIRPYGGRLEAEVALTRRKA